ncbi:MAG: YggS family pyridoxal phosphate-dependent enzyme [Candidatus Cryosericum sp.]
MGEIAERFAEVRERALASYRRAGNLPGEPRIVCVTKMQPLDRIVEAIEAGAAELGENYVQEAVRKGVFGLRGPRSVAIRYIGRMQSNKYNSILRLFDAVDSADLGILERTEDQKAGGPIRAQEFLLEVNAGDEAQKGGMSVGQIRRLAELRPPWLYEIMGLMTVVPLQATIDVRAKMYESVRQLLAELNRDLGLSRLSVLSMGTSDDFELALEHGSNMIRVGTAVFGPRSPSKM